MDYKGYLWHKVPTIHPDEREKISAVFYFLKSLTSFIYIYFIQ